MSTTEKEQEVVEYADVTEDDKVSNWRFLLPVGAFAISFVIHLFIGWVVFPKLLYSEKQQQPIDFNHKLHVDEMGECEGCHFFREDGSYSGIPPLSNCVECHEEAVGEDPEEARLISEYIEPEKEIPWLVYARQPDCVFFSHAAHVKMGEIECVTCHGPIGESENTRPYQYNRLTTYSRDIWGWNIAGFKKNSWDRMKMDDCGECHDEHGENNACFVCHK
jgi:hypothetical protein